MWIVKAPRDMAYYKFKGVQWRLIQLFDGTRTPTEILAEHNRRFGGNADLTVVLEWEELLRRMELIEQTAAPVPTTLTSRSCVTPALGLPFQSAC